MKNKKIFNGAVTVILLLLIINTFHAIYNYNLVCNNKKPKLVYKEFKQTNDEMEKNIYNILMFNLIEEKKNTNRTVKLKLFFMK